MRVSPYRVHQDLKLDNILIARGNSDSSYEFVPILTDFGHSYFRPMRQEHENGLVPDRHGNQEFGKATVFDMNPRLHLLLIQATSLPRSQSSRRLLTIRPRQDHSRRRHMVNGLYTECFGCMGYIGSRWHPSIRITPKAGNKSDP